MHCSRAHFRLASSRTVKHHEDTPTIVNRIDEVSRPRQLVARATHCPPLRMVKIKDGCHQHHKTGQIPWIGGDAHPHMGVQVDPVVKLTHGRGLGGGLGGHPPYLIRGD